MELKEQRINQILEITKRFYKSIGTEFSNTRQYSWKGWDSLFPKILNNNEQNKNKISILDIGCGNGRFYEYILNKINTLNIDSIEYLGIDADKNLLNIAKDKYSSEKEKSRGVVTNFEETDIFNNIDEIKDKYDLIVGFGITHHIPGKAFRIKWFEKVTDLLKKDGILVLSYWNFLDKKSLTKATDLEENDYWLGWNTTSEKRYCHYYHEKELNEIHTIIKNNNVEVQKTVENKEDLNKYVVYKRH